MWKGEDYLESNPKIVQNALDNYCAKLEHLKKGNPSKPEFLPEVFTYGVDNFIKRIREMQEILKTKDPDKIHRLEDKADIIRSMLKKYKEDTQKSLDKLKAEFGDDIPQRNDFTELMSSLDEAMERMNKL